MDEAQVEGMLNALLATPDNGLQGWLDEWDASQQPLLKKLVVQAGVRFTSGDYDLTDAHMNDEFLTAFAEWVFDHVQRDICHAQLHQKIQVIARRLCRGVAFPAEVVDPVTTVARAIRDTFIDDLTLDERRILGIIGSPAGDNMYASFKQRFEEAVEADPNKSDFENLYETPQAREAILHLVSHIGVALQTGDLALERIDDGELRLIVRYFLVEKQVFNATSLSAGIDDFARTLARVPFNHGSNEAPDDAERRQDLIYQATVACFDAELNQGQIAQLALTGKVPVRRQNTAGEPDAGVALGSADVGVRSNVNGLANIIAVMLIIISFLAIAWFEGWIFPTQGDTQQSQTAPMQNSGAHENASSDNAPSGDNAAANNSPVEDVSGENAPSNASPPAENSTNSPAENQGRE